jgi:hypothetical protein
MRAVRIGLCLVLATSCFAQDRFKSGQLAGFTISPTEHIINTLDTELTVREVKGTIAFEPSDSPLNGALIEIRGPGAAKTVLAATTSSAGAFQIQNVPSGEFFFKITLGGYQSLMGKMVVDHREQHPQPIHLQLKPGD